MDKIFRSIIVTTIFIFLSIELILSAAVYSKPKSHFEPFEPLCSNKTERFVKGDGKESSLFLEFRSSVTSIKRKFCERNLTAPESHGFIVRLVMPKMKKSTTSTIPASKHSNSFGQQQQNSKFHRGMLNHQKSSISLSQNLSIIPTKSCPLSIYSQTDIGHKKPLWKIDPCQLEERNLNQEDPVRLFDGHLKIVWEHGHNSIDSKLMITALGKGYGCKFGNKHPCLKVGDEALFCISKDLICDNIRHCPKGDEYNSDEDFEMCSKLNRPVATTDDGDFWEHLTMEIFKNFFTSDTTSSSAKNDDMDDHQHGDNNNYDNDKKQLSDKNNDNTNGRILPDSMKKINVNNFDLKSIKAATPTTTTSALTTAGAGTEVGAGSSGVGDGLEVKRNVTKGTLSGDLSKYGPWGYLMLGMLMCGGALLVCGLWECCCRRNKNDQTLNGSTSSNGVDNIEPPVRIQETPPNYDELDPPPSYSILFPNQKIETNEIASTSSTQNENVGGGLGNVVASPEIILNVTAAAALDSTQQQSS